MGETEEERGVVGGEVKIIAQVLWPRADREDEGKQRNWNGHFYRW